MFTYKSDKKELPKNAVISKQSNSSNRHSHYNEHFYPISSEMTQDYYAVSSTSKTLSPNNSSIVQRYLIVGNRDITGEYCQDKKNFPDKVEEILNSFVTGVAIQMLTEIERKISSETDLDTIRYLNHLLTCIRNDPGNRLRQQLKKWIRDDVGDTDHSKNKIFGQKYQPRAYHNWYDLAVALVGWVDAKQNRHAEKEIAQEVMQDKAVNFHLDSVFLKIKSFIDDHYRYKDEIEREIQNPDQVITPHHSDKSAYVPNQWAIYKSYFDSKSGEKMKLPNHWAVLERPDSYDIRQKTGVLHDLMHYFFEKFGDQFLWRGLPEFQATTLQGREDYKRPENSQIWGNRAAAKAGGTPLNLATGVKYSNEEQHSSYQYARRNYLPMYGRHSYSAARMMGLAKQANATLEEISAVSWAIMAYWRIHYDHTNIPYHTAHEIMDFTPAFGLTYNPKEHLAGFNAIRGDKFLTFLCSKAHSHRRAVLALMSFHNSKFERAKFFIQHIELWDIPDIMNCLRITVLPFEQFKQLPQRNLAEFFRRNTDLIERLPKERQEYIQSILK